MGTRPLVRMPAPQPQRGMMDRVGRMVQLSSMRQRQKLTQAQLRGVEQDNEAYEQAQREQALLQKLYMDADGKLDKMIKLAPSAGLGVEAHQSLVTARNKRRKENREMALADLEIAEGKAELSGRAATGIMSLPAEQRPEAILRTIPSLVEQGVISPEQAQQYEQFSKMPPEQLEQILKMFQLGAVDTAEQIKLDRQWRVDKETKRHNIAMEAGSAATLTAPTGRMKEFRAAYDNYLEATGKDRNAKIEREFRKEFNESRRTVVEKPPSRTSGASVKRAANRAIAAAEEEYTKAIRELDKFILEPADPSGEKYVHREDFTSISKQDLLAQRKQALADRDAAVKAAEASEQEELEFLGFEPGEPVDYRQVAPSLSPAPSRRELGAPQGAGALQQGPRAYEEGDTAFNKQTGKKVILRGGQWVPVQ